MKKFLLIFLILISAGCSSINNNTANNDGSGTIANSQSLYNQTLLVSNAKLNVQVVTTAADMQRGLSGRMSMQQDQGMLFNFGQDAKVYPAFWMPDMKFNLDFIWIYQNKVVGITSNVPAPAATNQTLPYYYPPTGQVVNWVLEVNAGWAEKNNLKVGDGVSF